MGIGFERFSNIISWQKIQFLSIISSQVEQLTRRLFTFCPQLAKIQMLHTTCNNTSGDFRIHKIKNITRIKDRHVTVTLRTLVPQNPESVPPSKTNRHLLRSRRRSKSSRSPIFGMAIGEISQARVNSAIRRVREPGGGTGRARFAEGANNVSRTALAAASISEMPATDERGVQGGGG